MNKKQLIVVFLGHMKRFFVICLICTFILPSRLFAGAAEVGGFLNGFNKGFKDGIEIRKNVAETEESQKNAEKAELEYYIMLNKLKEENPEAYNKFIQAKEEQERKAKEKRTITLVVLMGCLFALIAVAASE